MDSMSIMDCMSSCMAVMLGMQVQSMTPSMVIEDPPEAGAAGAAVVGAAVVVGAVSAISLMLATHFDLQSPTHSQRQQQQTTRKNNNNNNNKLHIGYTFNSVSYLHSETTVFLIPVLPVLGW